MDLTQFAWRDGVLLIAVAIGVYVAITLLRLWQIGHKRGQPDLSIEGPPGFGFPEADPAPTVATTEYELPFAFPPPSRGAAESDDGPGQGRAAVSAERPPGSRPKEVQSTLGGPTFSETLGTSLLEQEVRQLRAEVAALREELADLQAAQRVSPQYGDAMALARRGFDARGIADHCGIALGEAELVRSLARGVEERRPENEYDLAGPR